MGAQDVPKEGDSSQAIFRNLGEGVVVTDRARSFLFFNPQAERMLGISGKDLSPDDWMAAFRAYLPDEVTPYAPDDLPLARALRGEEAVDEVLFIRNSRQLDGVWISVSSSPLRNAQGVIHGGVMVFHDVTDQPWAIRKTAAEASRLGAEGKPARGLGPELDLQHFARFGDSSESLGQAVEQTADSVVITNRQGLIEYVNPAFETTTGYGREDALGKTPRILKSGEHDRAFYQKLWDQILSGQPYRGTITNRKKTGELYWAEQTITPMTDGVGNITHFVSVLKDVTELIQQHEHEVEMRLARQVQQRFYRRSATLPGFDLCAVAHPAKETGGDYVDFIPMPDGCLGIAVGDVGGHGFDSALVMAETRAYLRAFAKQSRDLGEVLTQVNRAILEDFEETKYVTLLLACVDPRKRSLVYANAGHVSGYVLRGSGEVGHVLESLSLPLGFFPNAQYSASEVLPLGSGEMVALLTDGVTEMAAPGEVEFFEAERAIKYIGEHRLEPACQITEGLYHAARAFAQGEPQKDDVSLVILKVD